MSGSVVVPRHPTEAMLKAGRLDGVFANSAANAVYQAMLAAAPAPAPAPSSLAGGAFDPQSVTLKWEKVETAALEEWRAEFGDYVALVTLGHDNVWAHRVNNSGRLHYKTADEAKAAALADFQGRLSIRLHAARKTVALYDAALSPEAPARMVGTIAHVSNGRSELAAHITAALTPRHEAPAEGAGERERLADAYIAGAMSVHEYWTENPGEAPRGDPEFDEAAGDYAYSVFSDLRAHSPAPEAREDALGNLLAVIHGDGGHRALEVGVEQAAAEAEKIVANLLSSAPEAREGEAFMFAYEDVDKPGEWRAFRHQIKRADGSICPGRPLYTHPAAPSADKLRIGLDEIARLVNQSGAIPKGELRSILSALEAEGA